MTGSSIGASVSVLNTMWEALGIGPFGRRGRNRRRGRDRPVDRREPGVLVALTAQQGELQRPAQVTAGLFKKSLR